MTKNQPKPNTKYPADPTAYGGTLLKTRRGRARPRPLSKKHSMHLVLRSSKATGPWSFKKPKNNAAIRAILAKFTRKYSIRIVELAIVGNHLHLQMQLRKCESYKHFIRAVSAAIAMAVTKSSRWQPLKQKFWDHRPFTRIARGLRAFKILRNYVQLNQLEALGNTRMEARFYQALNSS